MAVVIFPESLHPNAQTPCNRVGHSGMILNDAIWFVGLIPFAITGFWADDQPCYRQAINQMVTVLGVLCHGSHLIRHPLRQTFRGVDVLHSCLATLAVNLTTSAQPSTFVSSVVAMAVYLVNLKLQSPVLHVVGVQLVLWQALMAYEL